MSEKCYYCGVEHKSVEAQGLWHCPNLICTGPGATWFRSTLPSYKEEGDRHTVNEVEWYEKAVEYEKSTENKYGKFVLIPTQEANPKARKMWLEVIEKKGEKP